MRTVADVLASPEFAQVRALAGDPAKRVIAGVIVEEELAHLHRLPANSFVVLSAAASRRASGYQLDIAARDAAGARIAALTLTGVDLGEVPRTTTRVAARSGLPLLLAPPAMRLCELVLGAARVVTGGADVALPRAVAAMRAATEAASGAEAQPREICSAVSVALGVPAELREPRPGELTAPVLVDGEIDGHVCLPDPGGALADAYRLAARIAAEAAGRVGSARRRLIEAPIRTRVRLLSELLVASPHHAADLLGRARALGLPIDGWHLVLRFEVDAAGRDEAARFQLLESTGLAALQALGRAEERTHGSGWHLAYVEQIPLLIRMWGRDPGPGAVRASRRTATQLLTGIATRLPEVAVRCGIGSVHEGVSGLRVSLAEARVALSGEPAGPSRAVVAFDELGLHRMLVEWYTSASAQASVRELLAPLTALGPAKAETAIRTLRVYLDHNASLMATAAELNLHRNAVAYRIKRILATLDLDIDDADQRLALQLACRAWRLR